MSTSILQAIQVIAPRAKVDIGTIADTFNKYGTQYGVNTSPRIQAFLAQAAHETGGFSSLKEGATGSAYEGRLDLGNTQPGDGVRFKGRGIFQITGRSNYRAVSKALFGDERLLTNPELLEHPVYATISALYYWKSRNLSPLADAGNFEAITKAINGGLNGWADRLNYYQKLRMYVLNLDTRKKVALIALGLVAAGIAVYYLWVLPKINK